MEKGTHSRASSGPSYEVFLSFRGADTRHGFTDHLYHGMVDAGIIVFRDSESLHVGKQIGGELLQAIENSKIYIPIFSENYASSDWCLRELACMVECTLKSNGKKEILPIFLDVEPADVKLKTNLYRQTLSKRQKTWCTEAESWEKALIEVGKIKGWNWQKDQGSTKLLASHRRSSSVSRCHFFIATPTPSCKKPPLSHPTPTLSLSHSLRRVGSGFWTSGLMPPSPYPALLTLGDPKSGVAQGR
ncbi:disease resistance protein L6-like isoform X2 [Syzygium oleosum]|uniref:disease resistance protein L6-like isoform X2 n=1 Tax=Syzygium oleosum TaxID=219896 RepID=UPI0024BB5D0C|nr:disease resistance protein L6-like isoform X2 [Syzygium oleosum]